MKIRQAIQNKVLMYFNLSFDDSIKVVVDGIGISYLHIFKDDTTYYSFQSPEEGTPGYKLTTTLDTYEWIFRDTIISDYFNELRGYISGREYVESKTMTPLKQLREEKYAGLIKYSR